MKMFRQLSFLAIMLSTSASADCKIEDLTSQLSISNTVLNFRQSKSVASLSRPIVSSGIIWMSPNDKLIWQVLKPIKSTTVIEVASLTEFNSRDEIQPSIDNAVAADLSTIFLNILSGNIQALGSHFELNLSCAGEIWTLELKPNGGNFSEILTSISLLGDETLKTVSYIETRGDFTQIEFVDEPQSRPTDTSIFDIYLESQ